MVVGGLTDDEVDRLFHALADATRRDILHRCTRGEPSVPRLAAVYPMSFAVVQKHVALARPLNAPQSLSRPHPPILIAGGGERRTLPLVARFGDACNVPPTPELPRKLELLKRLCDQVGRDYGAIEKTAPFGFDVGPDGSRVPELLGQLRWLASLGVQTVLGWVVGVEEIRPIEVMGREVIPAVAEL